MNNRRFNHKGSATVSWHEEYLSKRYFKKRHQYQLFAQIPEKYFEGETTFSQRYFINTLKSQLTFGSTTKKIPTVPKQERYFDRRNLFQPPCFRVQKSAILDTQIQMGVSQ